MVKINEGMRRTIVDGASANEIKREAVRNGMRPIRWDGWEKVKGGRTTMEEVIRVTMEDEFSAEDEVAASTDAIAAVAGDAGVPA